MKQLKSYYLGILLRGLAMGAADIVPGVSGGTIAFITGIYETLLESLSSLNFSLLKTAKTDGFKAAWEQLNGNFLVALFAGIFISLISLSKLIKHLLENHPQLLWAFFFGLVTASIIYVGKQVSRWNATQILGLIVGSALAFYISLLPPMGSGEEYWYIFVCGMIAICAMILPGISGSFILLLLGAYQTVIGALTSMKIDILAVFALGCILGLISFSKLLNWMFKHAKDSTIAVLTGFLIGSLNKLWPWKENLELLYTHNDGREDYLQSNVWPSTFEHLTEGGDPQLMWAIGLAIAGFALIFIMERTANK